MIILFIEQSNEFIRYVCRDLNGSSRLERPVILKDLESDPYYPVCLIVVVTVLNFKQLTQIQKEYLRIRFHIIIRESNDNTLSAVIQIEKIVIRLPKPYVFLGFQKPERLYTEILVQFGFGSTVILIKEITQFKTHCIKIGVFHIGIGYHDSIYFPG